MYLLITKPPASCSSCLELGRISDSSPVLTSSRKSLQFVHHLVNIEAIDFILDKRYKHITDFERPDYPHLEFYLTVGIANHTSQYIGT